MIDDDRKGRADHSHLIWNLLNRELWFESFIDGGGKALSSARDVVAAA